MTIRPMRATDAEAVARIHIEGYGPLPQTGGAIVVTNHIGRLDAILGVILADRDDFILMIAEK